MNLSLYFFRLASDLLSRIKPKLVKRQSLTPLKRREKTAKKCKDSFLLGQHFVKVGYGSEAKKVGQVPLDHAWTLATTQEPQPA